MTLERISALGRKLTLFLALFADCFGRREGRGLLRVCVKGQLSNLHRKTAEAVALTLGAAPRTLQRFLESIKWDEERLRDRCQQIIARDHGHAEAIGCVDESGTAKSGKETVGVGRQYNGNRGKIDNCVVGVHLSYAAARLSSVARQRGVLAGRLCERPRAPKETYVPEEIEFRTKPQIAAELIDRALNNGVRVSAWTFDELYGRDGKFYGELEDRQQVPTCPLPPVVSATNRNSKSSNTTSDATNRPAPLTPRRNSHDCNAWASTSTASNPASRET